MLDGMTFDDVAWMWREGGADFGLVRIFQHQRRRHGNRRGGSTRHARSTSTPFAAPVTRRKYYAFDLLRVSIGKLIDVGAICWDRYCLASSNRA